MPTLPSLRTPKLIPGLLPRLTRRAQRPTESHALHLPVEVTDRMRTALPAVAETVVAAIIAEVPSYQDALSGPMGQRIGEAVEAALGGFLSVATRSEESLAPTAPALEGAYQLGRGEARSGRTPEALLAAYRVGARVSWREMSTTAVRAGLPPETLVEFAELVFAYIDELSDASAAGHADELATTGRVRQRLLERLARGLLGNAPADTVDELAERASWTPPATLSAVIVPDAHVGSVVPAFSPETLVLSEIAELDERTLLLVPDMHGRGRSVLMRAISDRGAVAGPAKPWREVRLSYARARRALNAGLGPDTEQHLVPLVLTADPDALADLRAAMLRPLAKLRPATVEKLTETLRAWLLHQGRRDEMARELFVHPQTVRYRMQQLRDAFGDRLDDPATVLALTVALGGPR